MFLIHVDRALFYFLETVIFLDWDDTLFPTASFESFATTDRALTCLASMVDPMFSLRDSTGHSVTEHAVRSPAELERELQWMGTALALLSSLPGMCDLRKYVWVVRDTLKDGSSTGPGHHSGHG